MSTYPQVPASYTKFPKQNFQPQTEMEYTHSILNVTL